MDRQPEVSSLIQTAELKSATISLTAGIRDPLGEKLIFAFGKDFDDLLRVEDTTQRARSVWKWQIDTLAADDSHGSSEVWGRGEEKRKREKGRERGRRFKLRKKAASRVTTYIFKNRDFWHLNISHWRSRDMKPPPLYLL